MTQQRRQQEGMLAGILEKIGGNIIAGWVSCQIVARFQAAYRDNQLPKDSWLYYAIFEACKREMMMALARLFDGNDQSVTLPYLLKYAGKHPEEFLIGSACHVHQAVAHHTSALERMAIRGIVRELRDRTLAHTDRKHLTSPQLVFLGPVELEEVEKAYREVLTILNMYKGLHNNTELCLSGVDESIDRGMAQLLRCLSGG